MRMFIKRIIRSDENLVLVTKMHWIYVVEAFFWLLALSLCGYLIDQIIYDAKLYGSFPKYINLYFVSFTVPQLVFTSLFTFIGALLSFNIMVKYLGVEVGLTSKRLIYKTGIAFVDVKEVDLEEIKGEEVDHRILGRLLNYGHIRLDCRFISDVYLPAISKPYGFLNEMNEMRSHLQDSSSENDFYDGN